MKTSTQNILTYINLKTIFKYYAIHLQYEMRTIKYVKQCIDAITARAKVAVLEVKENLGKET